jgi:hypothetical protein
VEELQDEVVAKEILRKAITDYNAAYPANS